MSSVKAEIAGLITKKVGIPNDKALLDVVLNFIKQNLHPRLPTNWMLFLPGMLT